MRTTQRAVLRKAIKKDSLRFLRYAGVKRRHAFYRSYRANCDSHRYHMVSMHSILDSPNDRDFPYKLTTMKRVKYEKPVILERYNNPPVTCHITKGV